jgi:large subunit ribosomal protein L29
VISLKASEIRDLSDEELAQKLEEAREEFFNLRFQHATGALENTTRIRDTRRSIARMLTIRHQRDDTTRTPDHG